MSWSEQINCGCKINLRLKITAKRADGFHELSTLFYPLDCPGDILEVSGGDPGMSLSVPGFTELEGSGNLVLKAAGLFAERSGIAPQWHWVLHKKAPIAAGVGGGSADAAAALRLLNNHYQAFDEKTLAEIAVSIGADVPFFLARKPAWATGIGEVLEIVEEDFAVPEVLIVYPGFPVSAKWAYTHMAKELISPDEPDIKARFMAAFAAPESADWDFLCRNDLAPALWEKFPLLGLLRDELSAAGALTVQVSGSGSSLFALFNGNAAAAAEKLHDKFGGMAGLRIFTGGREW
jgi:4-diphosphocytidyl-2-C-methyl-D-erythritol kinase